MPFCAGVGEERKGECVRMGQIANQIVMEWFCRTMEKIGEKKRERKSKKGASGKSKEGKSKTEDR